jgi:hypothetical protein
MGAKFDALFKAFKDNPTAAIMTLLVLAISAMFVINQKTNANVKDDLKAANKECAIEKHTLIEDMKKRDGQIVELTGAFKELKGEMNTLRKLGIVKE